MRRLSSIFALILPLFAIGVLGAQTVVVDKSTLSFAAQYGGSAVSQVLNVTSSGSAISFVAVPNSSWLTVNPASGTTPSAITVTANPGTLQPSATPYTTTLSIYGGTGSAVNVPVSMAVSNVGVSPQSLAFGYQMNGTVPAAQNVILSGQSITFNTSVTTTSGNNWLLATPVSGTSPGSISVFLNSAVVAALGAGTYNGTVTVTPTSGTITTPITIAVTLTVTSAPAVTLSTTAVSLAYQIGGANNQAQQTLTLSTASTQALSYGVTSAVNPNPSGRNWIVLSPTSGSIPAAGSTPVIISYDTSANLPAGTYSGTVTVTTPNASVAQQIIPVTLLVSSSPLLSVPGDTLKFTYEIGGSVPAAQTVTATSTAVATSSTTGQMAITAAASTSSGGSWLVVNPAGTALTTGMAIPVSVNPAGLTVGTYTGVITVTGTGAGNGSQTVPVSLTVANDPLFAVAPASVSFAYQIGQNAPASQNVSLTSTTGATLNYTATAAAATCGNSWLVLSGATTSVTNGAFTVSVNPAGLAAGTCTGTITITGTNPVTGTAVINSGLTIPVTLFVSANPLLVVSLPGTPAGPPVFTAQVAGSAPAAQTIALASTNSATPLNYTVAFTTVNNANWLFVGPLSGTTAAGTNTLTVSVLPGLLSAGTYSGTITITATNPGGAAVSNSPVTIPVTFNVTTGTLALSSTSLSFVQATGGAAPAAQQFQVASNGQALAYSVTVASNSTVNWLSATPASGTTPGAVSVSVDGSKLAAGTYAGSVTVTAPSGGNSPATVTVILTVTPGTISAPTTALTFTQVAGGSAPAAQTVAVSGTPSSLSFTLSTTTQNNGTWLTATTGSSGATSGSTPASVSVAVNAGTLAAGTYTGSVVITASGASGSPITIPVTLTVLAPQSLTVSPATLNFTYTLNGVAPASQTAQVAASGSGAQIAVATRSADTWLSVTPTSGAAPLSLTVKVITTGLAAGTYSSPVTITSPSSATAATLTVNLTVVAVPTPVIGGIANAASYAAGALAPGENIVIGGTGIGPATLAQSTWTAAGPVPSIVGNTQVLFDGVAAPILYASSTQTSVMVPFEVAGRPTTQVQVVYQGVASLALTYNIVPAAPGIYAQNAQGSGPGAILNQDGSVNGPNKPAAKGSYIAVYMTGAGATSPNGVTGGIAPLTSLKNVILPMTATIGGVPVVVTAGSYFAGAAPGIVEGVEQVNIQIPATVTTGPLPVVITFGSGTATYSTQSAITVQVQ